MSSLKNKIIRSGLNYKKEISILVIINILLLLMIAAILYFYKIDVLIISTSVAFLVLFNFIYLSRYSSLVERDKEENIKNFVSIFTFFRIYINNGYNVYTALKEIGAFANPYVMERLSELIHEIDNDKSVTPFIHFARSFDILIIEQLMINIYQMIDGGNNTSYLRQFELLFSKLSEESYEKEYTKKEKRLNTMTIFPLVASALLIVMICFGVVAIIGEMLNGI